jgi:hypothetical protein
LQSLGTESDEQTSTQTLGTDPRQHDPEMRQRLHEEGRRAILLDLTDLPPRFIDQSII